MVRAYETGQSMVQLAHDFGIHRTTVAQHLVERGVSLRKTAMTEQQIDEAVHLYKSGLSFAKIGTRLGFNASTITTQVRRRGAHIRGAHEPSTW